MFSLKNDIRNHTKQITKVNVKEVYETIRTMMIVIIFLLVIFLVSWILYVIWKVYCRRSPVVDESQSQEHIEMHWEPKAREQIDDPTNNACIISFIHDVFLLYHLTTHFEGICGQGKDIGNSTTLNWMKTYIRILIQSCNWHE